MSGIGHRKVRSDKKREVKPRLPIETKEAIYRISHITHMPVKDVCEYLTTFALRNLQIIDSLSKYFKRSIRFNTTYFLGDINVPTVHKRLGIPGELVTIKFKSADYETISTLAYALDCTPTRTTAILLELAATNIQAVNQYVYEYLIEELSESQISELRKVLSHVNRYNNDNSSWLSILSALVGDVRPATRKLQEIVEEFLSDN
ncbi:MAG: hypothetical protein KBT36_01420 [Kurthia sp.]|nr:hypothetical protein [Candidatus Kurthia equi]